MDLAARVDGPCEAPYHHEPEKVSGISVRGLTAQTCRTWRLILSNGEQVPSPISKNRDWIVRTPRCTRSIGSGFVACISRCNIYGLGREPSVDTEPIMTGRRTYRPRCEYTEYLERREAVCLVITRMSGVPSSGGCCMQLTTVASGGPILCDRIGDNNRRMSPLSGRKIRQGILRACQMGKIRRTARSLAGRGSAVPGTRCARPCCGHATAMRRGKQTIPLRHHESLYMV